jgi:hypothetical protein
LDLRAPDARLNTLQFIPRMPVIQIVREKVSVSFPLEGKKSS